VNSNNDSSNFWWWICTGIAAVVGIWNANLTFGRGKVIAELEKVIAEQDELIDEQNKQLQKILNEYGSLKSRFME